MTDKVFKPSDELISLVSDDNVSVTIKKGRLMKRTVYFKNMFSDVSSNKGDSSFGFNVSTKALLLYRQYLKMGKLTNEMYKDDDFMSLANRLGTKGLDADVYQLTVVEPMEEKIKILSAESGGSVVDVVHMVKGLIDVTIEEQDFFTKTLTAMQTGDVETVCYLKKQLLYTNLCQHMLLFIDTVNMARKKLNKERRVHLPERID